MYIVTICDRQLKVHYLEALAVPHIYTGPAAKSPTNLRTRFMRTYTPLSKEMHQTGEATDVCIGADYPHLQPKHIEQESRDGPLHIYKSIFGGGFILRGVEPGKAPAAPAAISADVAAAAVEEAAKARETVPEPKATLEVEVCIPEAAPAATEASPPPVAAQ